MARYSSFLGRRVEVQYRAGDILLPPRGHSWPIPAVLSFSNRISSSADSISISAGKFPINILCASKKNPTRVLPQTVSPSPPAQKPSLNLLPPPTPATSLSAPRPQLRPAAPPASSPSVTDPRPPSSAKLSCRAFFPAIRLQSTLAV